MPESLLIEVVLVAAAGEFPANWVLTIVSDDLPAMCDIAVKKVSCVECHVGSCPFRSDDQISYRGGGRDEIDVPFSFNGFPVDLHRILVGDGDHREAFLGAGALSREGADFDRRV